MSAPFTLDEVLVDLGERVRANSFTPPEVKITRTPFHVLVRQARENARLSQRELAARMEVTQTFINDVEQGRRIFTHDRMDQLHRITKFPRVPLEQAAVLARDLTLPLSTKSSPLRLQLATRLGVRWECLSARQMAAVLAIIESYDVPTDPVEPFNDFEEES